MAESCDDGDNWTAAALRQPSGRSRLLLLARGRAAAAPLRLSAEAPLNIVLDQATLMKLPERSATIVVGNPLIADVAVQPGGLVVVTGKGYGTTNLIALDRTGAMLMERQVVVRGASDRRSWSIAASSARPIAARRTASAASRSATRPAYFAATSGQADARNAQSTTRRRQAGALTPSRAQLRDRG